MKMTTNKFKLGVALAAIPGLLMAAGCACGKRSCTWAQCAPEAPKTTLASLDLPPQAKPGECYAKVFIPEQFKTQTETVCIREASERLEIVPAKYEWVEEKVMVKEASTILEEVPAQFAMKPRTVQTDPGHTGWHKEKTVRCAGDSQQWADEMYCLVSHDPVYQTIDTQVQVKPVTVREVVVPAEYQTVRRQKLVAAATTRRIPIPAEFTTVQKTYKVADSRVEWRRVECKPDQMGEKKFTTTSYTPDDYGPKPIE